MSSLGIAYRYTMLGKAVFPLAPNSKIPLISKKDGGRGVHDATIDRDQVDTWWQRCPEANVAMATGPISGCWVLDVDPLTSPLGAEWLAEREAEFGPLPVTPESRTLKGGRHVLFRWNDAYPVGNRVGFVRGLDARGDGGYIVAPPSFVRERKDGKLWEGKYTWLEGRLLSDIEIAEAPGWLLEAVMHKSQAQTSIDFVPRERREGDGFQYGFKALEDECRRIMSAIPGEQDNTIMSSAFKIGQLVGGGEIPRQDAEDNLINAAMAIPGQSKKLDIIVDKIQRALEEGGKKKRSAPANPERGRPQLKVVGGNALPAHDPETGEVLENEVVGQNWAMGLEWSLAKLGGLKPNSLKNVELMLTYHPKFADRFALNDFQHKVWITGGLPSDRGEHLTRLVSDNDYVAVASWLNTVGLFPSPEVVGKVMGLVASRNKFDPVADYLNGLTWDGNPRIHDWLGIYTGADDTQYLRTIGPRFLTSAVARVLDPGCKVDTMLVLEGPQGLKKSTLAKALFGPDWFSDQIGDVTSKESSIQIQGLWCVEVSEMDSFTKADDKAVKAFLSRSDDRYRPTYGLNTVEYPRRCVFVGTYNPDGMGLIKDATGARRYWFVACKKINIEGIQRDRDQLWAEAVANYRAGEQWWLDPKEEELAREEQATRQEVDMWDDRIADWLKSMMPGAPFKKSEVAAMLAIPVERQDSRVNARITKILNRQGCAPVRPYDDVGKQYYAWAKKEKE